MLAKGRDTLASVCVVFFLHLAFSIAKDVSPRLIKRGNGPAGGSPGFQRHTIPPNSTPFRSDGGLEVCNATPLPVHVAYFVLGPLHYQNWLAPGQCMTRNNIGNWWRDVEVRMATKGTEFDDGDNVVPWVTLAGTALTTACSLGTVGPFLSALGVSARVIDVANKGLAIAAGAGGCYTISDVVSKMQSRLQGYYSNCKTWRIKGGPFAEWSSDGVELVGNPFSRRATPYTLVGGEHYNCHDLRRHHTVDYPRVPRP
jgi:hypothetical protein